MKPWIQAAVVLIGSVTSADAFACAMRIAPQMVEAKPAAIGPAPIVVVAPIDLDMLFADIDGAVEGPAPAPVVEPTEPVAVPPTVSPES
ncbi:MAG: hypothetical protein ACI8S6_002457 [Myxococcota bacterium]